MRAGGKVDIQLMIGSGHWVNRAGWTSHPIQPGKREGERRKGFSANERNAK